MNEDLTGILNIYKEAGFTSHDVVNIVRKKLERKFKVGHTGTLDPDATGVLPICIGKATKLSNYVLNSNKEYIAIIKLGKTTTTQDASGETLTTSNKKVSIDEIKSVVNTFIGEIKQLPPMYSAIKIGGKKLYELAREGKEIEREKRTIIIKNIIINKFIDESTFEITVDCSKGTYIRTICNDIGQKLGTGAFMQSLIRTKAGGFNIQNAKKLGELQTINDIYENVINIKHILKKFTSVIIKKEANKYLYNGNKISQNFIKDKLKLINEKIVVYDEENNIIGIYEFESGYLKPLTMLI